MTALPSNIPKSLIVYNKAKFSFHHQIIMIYQKYIDLDAPLSINLSSETRDRLDKTLTTLLKSPPTPMTTTTTTTTTKQITLKYIDSGSYQEPELWGLLTVFEDVQELYRLLNSSWIRLRRNENRDDDSNGGSDEKGVGTKNKATNWS